ncbi:hypothetical protein [Neoactinobaculum massilliense]|uniref:hypothetical protein n=1 Tax=Neoactinobaculum massilliense TaxID=2364794 RepID=UPI000F51C4C4|nr:hypothetical protein [Neoactinobaculum massilliense]
MTDGQVLARVAKWNASVAAVMGLGGLVWACAGGGGRAWGMFAGAVVGALLFVSAPWLYRRSGRRDVLGAYGLRLGIVVVGFAIIAYIPGVSARYAALTMAVLVVVSLVIASVIVLRSRVEG